MKFINIASGSKGNSTLIYNDSTIILIDIGVSKASLVKVLKSINKNINDINYIFITHSHIDHIKNINIFPFNKIFSINNVLDNSISYNKLNLFEEYEFDDFIITPLLTSHDVLASCGYLIKENNKELVYITDTGYIPTSTIEYIKNKDIYIIESNHDINMLLESKRINSLKTRILSSLGHLSNDLCAFYLSEVISTKTKKIYLAHLSEECNTSDLALETACSILMNTKYKLIKENKIEIKCLKQKEITIYDEN